MLNGCSLHAAVLSIANYIVKQKILPAEAERISEKDSIGA